MNAEINQIQAALENKYLIKDLLKSGGMGKVFLGIHKALGKKVAIKIIHQELVSNEEIKERFYREAMLSASLDHPGIIKINDFGSHEDFEYIIMPYISGGNLQERIKEKPSMDYHEVISIIKEIAEALQYAHSKHVVHRDIKPANIMFNEQGRIVITDFGISKNMDNSELTMPNTVLGSPKYMSPEQIKGEPVDARSDLYSLGLIFYEMLTGKHPFLGKNKTTVYYCQLHEIPPSPETIVNVPKPLASIVMKLLEKTPARRYTDGLDLLRDLDDIEAGRPISSMQGDGEDALLTVFDKEATVLDKDSSFLDEEATFLDEEATFLDEEATFLDDGARSTEDKSVFQMPGNSAPEGSDKAGKLSLVGMGKWIRQHPGKTAGVILPLFILVLVIISFSGRAKDNNEADSTLTPPNKPSTEAKAPAPDKPVETAQVSSVPAKTQGASDETPHLTAAAIDGQTISTGPAVPVREAVADLTDLKPPAPDKPFETGPISSLPAKTQDASDETPPLTTAAVDPQKKSPEPQLPVPKAAPSTPNTLEEMIFSMGGGNISNNFSVWTNKNTYDIGDVISYHFKSSEPCYAIVLALTTQGQIVQIFPNFFQSNQFVMPNMEYSIPDKDMAFQLEVTGPAGQDNIIALIHDIPFSVFDESFSETNPFLSQENTNSPGVQKIMDNLVRIKDFNIGHKRLTYHINQ
jgi:serine/threonine protein kinase